MDGSAADAWPREASRGSCPRSGASGGAPPRKPGPLTERAFSPSRLVKLRFSPVLVPLLPALSAGATASASSCLREPARRTLTLPRKVRPWPPEAGRRDPSACAACGAAMRVARALRRPSAGREARQDCAHAADVAQAPKAERSPARRRLFACACAGRAAHSVPRAAACVASAESRGMSLCAIDAPALWRQRATQPARLQRATAHAACCVRPVAQLPLGRVGLRSAPRPGGSASRCAAAPPGAASRAADALRSPTRAPVRLALNRCAAPLRALCADSSQPYAAQARACWRRREAHARGCVRQRRCGCGCCDACVRRGASLTPRLQRQVGE